MKPLRPCFVADVGGTQTRFGLAHWPGGEISEVEALRTADFASFEEAASDYLARRAGARPQCAALAVAAPVEGDVVALTNSTWVLRRQEIGERLKLGRVLLLNDFAALALSLHLIEAKEIRRVGGGNAVKGAAMAVLGPGTGLGAGIALPHRGEWIALEGEGGHVSLAPADALEAEIIAVVRQRYAHVSAERLLSGTGLPLLREAIARVEGRAAEPMNAVEISRAGLQSDGDSLEKRALEIFCAMLGGVAGNLALVAGARGGVFVGGGIVPQWGAFFERSAFRERFESKGRFADYLRAIPTSVIVAETPALRGAAYALRHADIGEGHEP